MDARWRHVVEPPMLLGRPGTDEGSGREEKGRLMPWAPKRRARERLVREVILAGAGYRAPGGIRACLLYPNTYQVGMSNLGFQTMHRVLNALPGLSCERAFLPDRARDDTHCFSLETQTPLAEFDVLGISLSYEMDYPNAARALLLAGIPPLARDRRETHPLVVAGGPCATYNPEPLADLLDACVIGEGEEVMADVAAVLREVSMARGASRGDLLAALAQVPGVYVPSLYAVETGEDGRVVGFQPRAGAPATVARRWVRDLDAHPCASFILTPDTQFGDLFCVEIIRGCGRGCRFCAAGYITRPPRARSRAHILEWVAAALPYRRKVGLVGPSISDYPDLAGLVEDIAGLGGKVSASSLRADMLLSAPVKALAGSGETAITIAPEAGSQRLRHAVNKSLTDEEIYAAVAEALAAGIRRVKLYLMIGLPTETEADVDAIIEMCRRIADTPGVRRVTASVNPFVPKPGTPFQWCAMAEERVLSARLKRVRDGVKDHPKIEVGGESPREAILQAALSRGDRRLAPAILSVARGQSWRAACREQGIALEAHAHREIPTDSLLPWDGRDLGVRRRVLLQELAATRAASSHRRGGLTEPCRVETCRRCGVCPE
ncbi:MAG: radical SAM protein [Armatimonadetes bacterium]|nr:radical SAM protein [Armatimonadota bacterium]